MSFEVGRKDTISHPVSSARNVLARYVTEAFVIMKPFADCSHKAAA